MISGVGILLSVFASVLFCLMSAYTRYLEPLDGLMILAWRLIWTLPGLLLLVHVRRQMPDLKKLLIRFSKDPRMWWQMPLLVGLLAAQLWVFLWAPVNGQMMPVAMGYFLLPLVMVAAGRLFYHEHLGRLQRIAIVFALLGIGHEWWVTQAFSWPTLLVAFGYPPYFMLRKHLQLDAATGFTLEILLLFPVAIGLLCTSPLGMTFVLQKPLLLLLLPGLGLISTLALASNLAAHRLLPMGIFGILGYVEPVLLFITALAFFHEPLSFQQLFTYGPIAIAVILTGFHSVRILRHGRVENAL